ncbi:Zinc finger CCHC domain-containing protein 8 [Dispira simplex]|nr:Zinc finger CCHC domain-containing protein 8 [Dispira simplex]
MVDHDNYRSALASLRHRECSQRSQPLNNDAWTADAMTHATRVWRNTPEAQLIIGVRDLPRWKNEYLQRCIRRVLQATHPLDVENVPTPTRNAVPFQGFLETGRKQLHSTGGDRTESTTPRWVHQVVDILVEMLERTDKASPSDQSQLYSQGYVSLDWLCSRLPHRLRRQVVPLQLEKYIMEIAEAEGSFSRLEFDPEKRTIRLSRPQATPPRTPSITEQSDTKAQTDMSCPEGSPRENPESESEPQVDSMAQDDTESVTKVAVPDQVNPIQEHVQGFTVYLDADLCLDFTQHTFDSRQQYLGPFHGQYEPSVKFVLDDPLVHPDDNVTGVWEAKVCFNCLAPDHELNDCPLPWDSDRIDHNRDLHRKHAVVSAKDLRYYVSSEESSQQRRLGEFRPGELSGALREALGFNLVESPQSEVTSASEKFSVGNTTVIPEYVERMYWFGYPPGYISTEPNRDPLYAAKTYVRPFSPLVIYGDDDIDVEQNTPKDTKADGDKVQSDQPRSSSSTTSIYNDYQLQQGGTPWSLTLV